MEKKNRLTFNISLLSLFGLLVCIGTIIFQNSKIGVVTIDTYLGVVATLIGICATIMVGFQIINFMELKNIRNQIKDIDAIKISILEKEEESKFMYGEIGNIYVAFLTSKTDDIISAKDINNYVSAICFLSQSGRADYTNLILLYKLLHKSVELISAIPLEPSYFYAMKNLRFNATDEHYQELSDIHYKTIAAIIEKLAKTNNNE